MNVGCVPSKHFLDIGKEIYNPAHPKYDSVSKTFPEFNFKKASQEKKALLDTLRQSNYLDVLNNFHYIELFEGKGVFGSEHIIEISGKKIEAEKIIITTGCSAKVLPITGLSKAGYLTNIEALSLTELPESLVILGGGPLGLEFAQIFSRMGSKVTIIEYMDRILDKQEPEVSDMLNGYLQEEGITIVTGVSINEVKENENQKEVMFEKDNKTTKIIAENILVATGVSANTENMGLEKAGVNTDGSGYIEVNDYLKTNVAHIYAAGDCVGHLCLETVAAKEGKFAVENAFENAEKKMNYNEVPYAVFTDPEVASVGFTEKEYIKKYNMCSCRTVNMKKVPKALAINDTRGLIKMVIHHETGKIMGVHILSPVASEMIHEATLAIKFGLSIDDIIDTVHVFPTFSEAIKIVAQAFRRDISTMSCCIE